MNRELQNSHSKIDELCVNTLRTLAMDAVQKANSGHPGAPMGLATAAYALWTKILKHNPGNPCWADRDRFVLSGGHASMLLYGLLFLSGYDLDLDDLKKFRQWDSKTPGHPEYWCVPGVETTTGPLGQGFANGVGMALAERHLAALFNRDGYKVVDHFTYVMCGDGDLMEGVTSEAASLAGHLGLAKLICIYDDNKITIEGSTDISFTEDVALRFQAYNWHVIKVDDGNDMNGIVTALETAKKEDERPSLIVLRTHIAFGSPNKQDSASAHGEPLGEEEIRLTKRNLEWPEESFFHVPEEVLKEFRYTTENGRQKEREWLNLNNDYKRDNPELAGRLDNVLRDLMEGGWYDELPEFLKGEGPVATRAASGRVLNSIAEKVPVIIGGSADLAPSNKTIIESSHDFHKGSYDGRNIRFGVREHAMGGIISGIALHGGLIPYSGTFLVFADYMRPSIRLASLMGLNVIYVFTHDSIAVGEDGPTHQPVEHLASLRAIPGLIVIRPADANETREAWIQALKIIDKPVALILSRQKVPVLDRATNNSVGELEKGAYIISDSKGDPDIILIATGSEVHLGLRAAEILRERDIAVRVVSMPSVELFEQNPQEYKDKILPPGVRNRVVIEAAIPMGWEGYAGEKGRIIGINCFGASAPGGVAMEKYGFTAENIVEKVIKMLEAS